MKITISLVITIIILISCKTSSEPKYYQFEGNIPYGTWVYVGNDDSISIYYLTNQFEEDKPGFAIEEENVFIERTSGWCATPPLTFFNVEGKWEVFDDNTLKIISSNWIDENYSRLMEIVSLNNNELKVIFRSIPK
jgi:hypothetical protein